VDDPYIFGQIVAANCMSDVWAMGGKVLTCLNLLGYPPKKMDTDSVAELLRGCSDKIQEAGAVLCGGHTWMDPELRVGLAVTGTIHPDRIITNADARPGDALILTKSLGSGILSLAAIQGMIDFSKIGMVIRTMTTLNLHASKAMVEVGVHACTDVTGFSLLGHAAEMAEASHVGMEITLSDIPMFDGVHDLAARNVVLPLGRQNELSFRNHVQLHPDISRNELKILYDPQTSGGLLISVSDAKKEDLLNRLKGNGVQSARIIGRATEENPGKINVVL
jgi:selenide,water dikinase